MYLSNLEEVGVDEQGVERAIEVLTSSVLELDRDAAVALASEMWPLSLDTGEFLCLQGERSDRFFVVMSGQLAVQASSSTGRELVFTSLGVGEPIGEVSIFDAAPRSAHIRAVVPTDVLAIGRDGFLALIARHPGVAVALAKHMARIVRRLSENVEGTSFLPLSKRLVDLLGSMPDVRRRDDVLVVLATQQQLADRLGSSRESVNKLLRRWAADGLVILRRGSVEVPDLAALRAATEV